MKRSYQILALFFSAYFVALMIFGAAVWCGSSATAASVYSDVISDLSESENFNEDDYLVSNTDYSLHVITIAESSDNELFVYVYQPCFKKNFRATSVSLSVGAGDIKPRMYHLTFINKSGTLYKYKVNDLTVSSDSVRYYEIVSIFRKYDPEIDSLPSSDTQTITEVVFSVAKKWCIDSRSGQTRMECVDIQTIEVADKFVGYVRYEDGFKLYADGACDSHFVAFITDKPIDKLFEADVYYTSQSYHRDWAQTSGAIESFGTVTDNTVTLNYEQTDSYQGGGLFAKKFVWNRIESVSDFIRNTESSTIYSGALLNVNTGVSITDEAKAELQNKAWVLRFAETTYSYNYAGSGISAVSQTSSTLVGNVSILRLFFETDGVIYNLGVVDNKQTGPDKPINTESTQTVSPGWLFDPTSPDYSRLIKILMIVLGIILALLLLPLIIDVVRKLVSGGVKTTKTAVKKAKKYKYRRK